MPYEVRELFPPVYANRSPESVGDWVRLLREGLPGRGLQRLLESLDLSRTELCAALDIPERTLTRRLKEGRLTPEESGKVLRLGRAWERASAIFPDEPAARGWMKSPNATLQGATPLSLLDTDIGAEAVMDLLGRIQHGVFS